MPIDIPKPGTDVRELRLVIEQIIRALNNARVVTGAQKPSVKVSENALVIEIP